MNAPDQPAASPSPADRIISARYVVPVEPAGLVLEDHAVVIRDGRIAALLPTDQALSAYAARVPTPSSPPTR